MSDSGNVEGRGDSTDYPQASGPDKQCWRISEGGGLSNESENQQMLNK